MRLCLLTISLVLLLSGCANTEVTLLFGPRQVGGDTEPGVYLGVMKRYGERMICGYIHGSDPNDGKPFNRESEMSFDQIGCGIRYEHR